MRSRGVLCGRQRGNRCGFNGFVNLPAKTKVTMCSKSERDTAATLASGDPRDALSPEEVRGGRPRSRTLAWWENRGCPFELSRYINRALWCKTRDVTPRLPKSAYFRLRIFVQIKTFLPFSISIFLHLRILINLIYNENPPLFIWYLKWTVYNFS